MLKTLLPLSPMRKLFVTGIGTDVGKTIVSAILVEALKADYWKPIQAGFDNGTDTQLVKQLISNNITTFFQETYLLKTPASPHQAASNDGVEIELNKLILPNGSNKNLIIEGAGGLLVPLNNNDYVVDLITHFDCEVVLVSRNYLGSINHTLLSIEALKSRGLKIAGIVFNGERNKSTEEIILKKHDFPFVEYINQEEILTKEIISAYSLKLNKI